MVNLLMLQTAPQKYSNKSADSDIYQQYRIKFEVPNIDRRCGWH